MAMGWSQFLYWLKMIVRQRDGRKNRFDLLVMYLRLCARGILPGFGRAKVQKILGWRVGFLDRAAFVGLVLEIFLKRVYEVELSAPAPFIIDCGSNIGLSVLYFKGQYADAEIVAFEPDARAFAKLQANIGFVA